MDSSDNIYVADTTNNRIQKFNNTGVYLSQFGSKGSGNGQFNEPKSVAVDSSGNIFVADTENHRIQKFNSAGMYQTQFGSKGSGNGQFEYPHGIAVDSSGSIFVADSSNHRIQKWAVSKPYRYKAIIVAGGGNYATNALWNATKLNADHAYSALTFQGYNSENIYYLSADKNIPSPAGGFASMKNFEDAIAQWAQDANNLLIYMADHGGNGTFRMNENEILPASQLDGWLDSLQQTIPGDVILIYDACESGSFIGLLTPQTGTIRIIATSASAGESAIFASGGTLSFSWLFWSQIYTGLPFYQTFLNTQNSMSLINPQNPLIDADGNGIPGQKSDSVLAANIRLGEETAYGADFPLIGSVSPPQTLTDKTSALIYAENVTDTNGIKKVWAVINPPDIGYSPDDPVIYLPTVELYQVGSSNRYEAAYNGFTAKGIYKIAVFATDSKDFTSISEQKHITSVTQTQDLSVPAKKGDISGDDQVNLTDVISVLQVLSGLNPSGVRSDYGSSGADVNGDNRMGLQEVVYVLQVVSGLR